ncbi:MAG: GAK system CofD-like protein [Deltaproteobacteria bacterium]|nr:GAK system CofD-like protein [Deltaproteobacteria bacterium]
MSVDLVSFQRVAVRREVKLPDPERLGLLHTAPALGPRLLFFSGGSALKELSQKLVKYTSNSIHLITPFDSGGSSAVLREAFRMPAIGDIRNRLMALADQSICGNPEIYRLFAYRLPQTASPRQLAGELKAMVGGRHELITVISTPMRKIIRHHLKLFDELKPEDFNLAGANIGNLILTAGYLENRRHLDPIIYIYSKLAEVRGVVRPVVSSNCHLAAQLADGRIIVGQHRITGNDHQWQRSRIEKVFLVDGPAREKDVTATVAIRSKICDLIAGASLICYPMGSFFSSLIASLLPAGVGRAIARNSAPKIYFPSTGYDPETLGLELMDQVETLLSFLKKDDPSLQDSDLLNFILLDSHDCSYRGRLDMADLARRGITIIYCDLVSPASDPLLDAESLAGVLLSLA